LAVRPAACGRPGERRRLPAGTSPAARQRLTGSPIGSIVGTRADLAEVFRLHAAGRTRVIYQTRPLAEVNACFEEVLAGGVPAQLVFRVTR
jgi:D-arabinose 1-dehydrogenase-like Zn-dependent alcohol dehydrogenase